MTEELTALKEKILAGAYSEALDLIDELEEMSRHAILRNIDSYLVRLLIHLLKAQVENRMTGSWQATISDSIRQIQKLNLMGNKSAHDIKQGEWQPYLEEALAAAIAPASVEIFEGKYKSLELESLIDSARVMEKADKLLSLIYLHSAKSLPRAAIELLEQ